MVKGLLNIVFIVLIGLFATHKLNGQSLKVNKSVVKVAQNESFELNYSLSNADQNTINLPSFKKNFDVISGPNTSKNFQFINGKTTGSYSVGYYLRPKKQGTFILPSATAVVNGKTLKSSSVKIIVGPPSELKGPRSPAKQDEVMFFKTEIDTTEVYIGQQLSVKYRLYSSIDISNYTLMENPAFTGFWVQDISPQRITPSTAFIDDVQYKIYDLKEYILFPQKSGAQEVEGLNVSVDYRVPLNTGRQSFFQRYTSRKADMQSEPAPLLVKALPEANKPANFSGAVGSFGIRSTVDKAKIDMSGSVNYRIVIKGTGNLKLMDAPKPDFGDDFQVYEPEINEVIRHKNGRMEGSITYDYVLIPKKAGTFKLPQYKFHFFAPKTNQYEEARSRIHTIVVGSEGAPQEIVETEQESEEVFQDIIKSKISLKKASTPFSRSFLFWPLLFLPFLIAPMLYVRFQKQEAELADVVGRKKRGASKVALQKLAKAKSHLDQNETKAFYDEIVRAIWNYLGDKFDFPAGDYSKEFVGKIVKDNQLNPSWEEKITRVISQCEQSLYAPGGGAGDMQDVYRSTQMIIENLKKKFHEALDIHMPASVR